MAIHIGIRSSPQQLRRTDHNGIGFFQQPQFISKSILVYTGLHGLCGDEVWNSSNSLVLVQHHW